MDDPSPYLIIYIGLVVLFLIYAMYYNVLRRLSFLRGAMMLGLLDHETVNPEKIEYFESKLLSLQIGRLIFLIPMLSFLQISGYKVSYPLFFLASCLVVFTGEIILPAQVSMRYRDKSRFSKFEIQFINFLAIIFFPITFLFFIFRETWFRLVGNRPSQYSEHWLEDEIKAIIKVGEHEGIFKETEKELLESIIEFGDTIIREVMTPRTDIVSISSTESIVSLRKLIVKVGHSRIPVFHEKIDNIIGIVYAKDILKFEYKDFEHLEIKSMMRDPIFVPETKKVRELLAEFKKDNIHMAIVVDEYGGVAGLVTIEDLIEEIIGEIRDEYDQEAEPIQELDNGNLLVDAKTYIDNVEDYYQINIPRDDFDTIGGFIINKLGRVPKTGEKITYENLLFEIVGADARHIKNIRISKSQPENSILNADE